ncbi:MAG TPA: hypothetical protein VMK83_12260 [Gaiellaceae bacterium]|nr:hypothetical protein [Gaiellaceae bacterium]
MSHDDGTVYVDREAGRVYYLAWDGILAAAPIRAGGFSMLEGRAVESPDGDRHSEIRSALERARLGDAQVKGVHRIRVRRDGIPQPVPEEDG